MKKSSVLLAITTAVSLAVAGTTAQAASMEKCSPTNKEGKSIIKAHKNDCKGAKHSCAGQSMGHDSDAWIYVPTGLCDKIKASDWKDVPKDICDKLDGCTK